ncbi:hypothetical protein EJI01_16480 [Variovorax sp. MHTC-1]|nr:hypothetical protein EJI01_16480 [Variovorax sp. MHTC-1]
MLLLLVTSNFALAALAEGEPFAVVGEQLDHPSPLGWKLAWMSGEAEGSYVAEYVPATEEINSWREGYLAIERLKYPPAEKLDKRKTMIADVLAFGYGKNAKEKCGGRHFPMVQRADTFNGTYLAVGGGFCDSYGPAAPFGEGAIFAFAEGKEFLFRIQYGWRPKSAQEQRTNIPWRIDPETARRYIEAIKTTALCNGPAQPLCRGK